MLTFGGVGSPCSGEARWPLLSGGRCTAVSTSPGVRSGDDLVASVGKVAGVPCSGGC